MEVCTIAKAILSLGWLCFWPCMLKYQHRSMLILLGRWNNQKETKHHVVHRYVEAMRENGCLHFATLILLCLILLLYIYIYIYYQSYKSNLRPRPGYKTRSLFFKHVCWAREENKLQIRLWTHFLGYLKWTWKPLLILNKFFRIMLN